MAQHTTATGADDTPLYPSDHAFVIALRRDTDVAAGQFVGRVEHVSSGRTASFADVAGLLAFMRGAAGHQPRRTQQ